MSDAPVQTQAGLEAQPPMLVRRLHDFIYCPRLFYFQWVENIFQENADTVAGSSVHRNVDAPSRLEDPKELGLPEGAKIRSLRLESEALGLIGVVDIVEGGLEGAEIIDYTNGSARRGSDGAPGVEGTAAALYFEQFESMLKQREDWRFDWRGRNRRPPRDPVNALLSLGYSMLAKELTGVRHAVGLDPFLGFMHQPRSGRPALALDLKEEFRPLIADSVAISLINRGELGPEDFIRSANGTFLNERGKAGVRPHRRLHCACD